MPLHVDIKINDKLLGQVHITRVEGGTGLDDVNRYLAVDGDYPKRLEDWHIDGIPFVHRYGDGAVVCVQKALEALYGKVD